MVMLMNVFELSPAEGKPSNVVDCKLNFLSESEPTKGFGPSLANTHFTYDISKANIKYMNSSEAEGVLNFYLCRFSNGKCHIHLFGKLHAEYIQFEIYLGKYSESGFDHLHDRMGHIILKSRSMLKRYYKNGNSPAIQNHLLAFLK
jgi:hypothetical protein